MQYLEKLFFTQRIQWIAPLFGFLLACWVMRIQHGWVNDDSVLYFECARLIADGQFKASMQLFPWPLYASLIALVHKLTGFNIHFSAQIINASLFALTSYAFIKLILQSGGSYKTALFGALLLFTAPYITGDILPMLLRDQGFWAFTLLGLSFFIQYYRTRQFSDAIIWQLLFIIATLFRVEGFAFLITLPFVLFFDQLKPLSIRLKHLFKAHIVLLIVACIGFVLVAGFNLLKISDLGRLNEVSQFIQGNFVKQFGVLQQKADTLGSTILGDLLSDYSMLALLVGLGAIVVAKVITTAGWVPTLLIASAYKTKVKLNIQADAKMVLLWALLIHLANMCMILMSVYVLSGRYVIGFSLILIIFASFIFANWSERYLTLSKTQKISLWLFALIISLSFIKIIYPKSSQHAYEQQAVVWIKANNPQNQPVFYTSARARFYAGQPFTERGYDYWSYVMAHINNKTLNGYPLLSINIEREHLKDEQQLLNALPQYKKIHEIYGPKNKKKIIILSKKSS